MVLSIEDVTPVPPVPDIPVSFEDLPILNVPAPVIPVHESGGGARHRSVYTWLMFVCLTRV